MSQLGIGGLELQVLELIRNINKNKFTIFCCPLWKKMALLDEFNKAGATIVRIQKSNSYDIRIIPKLIKFIKFNNIDILHTWIFTANSWGRFAGILANVPSIICSERNEEHWKKIIHKSIDYLLSLKTEKIIANSKRVENFLINKEKINRKKIDVIYNGVDFDRFSSINKEEIRKTLTRVKKNNVVIGTIANFNPQKDYRNLLKALSYVYQKKKNISLLVIGKGNLEAEIKKHVKKLQLENIVTFLGRVKNVEDVLHTMDIFVLASEREGFANVILEAMASSLPVVATNVGGNSEAIIDNNTGYIVPKKDPKALADKIIKLIDQPDLANTFGNRGHERSRLFSIKKMVNSYEELYFNLYYK